MKVEINRITESGIQVHEDIPAASWELDSDDVKFVRTIGVDGDFKRLGKEILATVVISVCRQITCSRCLEEGEQPWQHSFVLSYNVNDMGETLDVDNDIREEILLNFPMKVLCDPGCKGLCLSCGGNLNKAACDCKAHLNLQQ